MHKHTYINESCEKRYSISLILSPNFFTKKKSDVVFQSYFSGYHYKSYSIGFVMACSDKSFYDYIIFVFRTEVGGVK